MGCREAISLVFALAIMSGSMSRAGADVIVERNSVVVERRTFDPAHRPTTMPALKSGEAAVTESQFDCAADLTYKIIERRSDDTSCTVALKVQAVRVKLSLKVTIWIPAGAPPKLMAHEEGHRQIDERIYEDAVNTAKDGARGLDGQVLRATAADCASAEQNATQSAADEFCRNYLREIGRRAGRISDEYDKLTAHGTKAQPAEDVAIRDAFKCDQSK